VLIRNYIVFIFWVDRLVVRRHVNVVVGQLVLAEVFEEISVPGPVEVDVGVGGIF
jgi:hypothetical protein